jgi:hypothetical protein
MPNKVSVRSDFLKSVCKNSEASRVELATRRHSLVIRRLSEPADQTAVPSEHGRVHNRGTAKDVPNKVTQ